MKPWNAWLYSLGFAGICLMGTAGCGGGDVPDASDSASEADGGAPAEPSLPPPAPAAPPAAVAAQPGGPGAAPHTPPPAGQGAPAEAAEAATDAPAAKVEGNSATAEMLAIATGGNQANAEAEAGTGANPGAPGPGGMMGGMRPMAPGGGQPGMAGMMGMRPPTSPPGGPGGAQNASQMAMMNQMAARTANGGPPGGPGMAGMAGMMAANRGMQGPGGGAKQEGDTRSPDGAVKAFLSALKAKDRERLAEATALRASSAAEGGKNREMFARINDSSISDTELNDLASKLEGFTISGANQPKSTGQLGITTKKNGKNGGWLQRTFTVRREKKGWGVLDIATQVEFKGSGMRNMNQQGAAKK